MEQGCSRLWEFLVLTASDSKEKGIHTFCEIKGSTQEARGLVRCSVHAPEDDEVRNTQAKAAQNSVPEIRGNASSRILDWNILVPVFTCMRAGVVVPAGKRGLSSGTGLIEWYEQKPFLPRPKDLQRDHQVSGKSPDTDKGGRRHKSHWHSSLVPSDHASPARHQQ